MSEAMVKVILSANIKYCDNQHKKSETILIKESDLESFQKAKVVAEVLEVVDNKEEKALEEMTVTELKSYAKEKEIDLPVEFKKKDEILEFLLSNEEEEEEEGQECTSQLKS